MEESIEKIKRDVTVCAKCPRLVEWREKVAREKVKRFSSHEYWGKAVPGFGDPKGRLLIVGLAPAAHGANRTGRMFTGDRSGEWLYRALFRAGFASQAESVDRNDSLTLTDCYITAVARCAPPQNKPTNEEFENCREFLLREIKSLQCVQVVLGLGKLAFDRAVKAYEEAHEFKLEKRPTFSHGAKVSLPSSVTVFGSYHPSQQNTFTKRLTEPMFDGVFREINLFIDRPPHKTEGR